MTAMSGNDMKDEARIVCLEVRPFRDRRPLLVWGSQQDSSQVEYPLACSRVAHWCRRFRM